MATATLAAEPKIRTKYATLTLRVYPLSTVQCGAGNVLDGRSGLYFAADLDAAMNARPGKGANLRRASGSDAASAPQAAPARGRAS